MMEIQPTKPDGGDRVRRVHKVVGKQPTEGSTSDQGKKEREARQRGPTLVDRDGVKYVVSTGADGDVAERRATADDIRALTPKEPASPWPDWMRRIGKWVSDHI